MLQQITLTRLSMNTKDSEGIWMPVVLRQKNQVVNFAVFQQLL